MFFFATKINYATIKILCILLTYKDEGGSYDIGL